MDKIHSKIVSVLGDWTILVYVIFGVYFIFGLGLFAAILLDMFIQWHAPIWPFSSLSEFLKLIRVVFVSSFIIGIVGICAVKVER